MIKHRTHGKVGKGAYKPGQKAKGMVGGKISKDTSTNHKPMEKSPNKRLGVIKTKGGASPVSSVLPKGKFQGMKGKSPKAPLKNGIKAKGRAPSKVFNGTTSSKRKKLSKAANKVYS